MFQLRNNNRNNPFSSQPISFFESLESRQLLHGGFGHGQAVNSIEFSQAPSAVQAGLNTLATSDNLTAPTADQKVTLGNSNGIETYTVRLTESGGSTTTKLTVDVAGNEVTAPTKTTTTFDAINNSAVTDEFNAIASGLGLTAPAASDKVNVSTPASGPVIYTLRLVGTSGHRGVSISVDDTGSPVGNEQVPFSALSSTIQDALNANAPSGATAIDPTSTQKVSVKTLNGVTTYSVTFSSTGVKTTVTVNAAGALTDLPSTSSDVFSNIPVAAQTELQTLATADGVSTTIDTAQSVRVYDEANGTIIYSVTLAADNSSGNGTHWITLSVDEDGNPTIPPSDGSFGGFGGGCGGGIFGGSGFGFGRIGRRPFGFRF